MTWTPPEPLLKLQERVTALILDGKRDYADALMREACLAKPYGLWVLLRYGMGRTDAHNQWVFDRCCEVQANPDGYLDLWAREHFKSSVITFALSVQDILTDPEVTIGIFSHTRPIAKAFLRQIKQEFERNERLKRWFPDILWADPVKQSPKWSEDEGIVVKRKTNPKEATVEAWGVVDGQPTSKHFEILVYDDVVTEESVTQPDMIAKTTNRLALSYNLGKRGGRRRFIGTRYHFNDTYRVLMERRTAIPRLYPATADGTVEGEPVFLSRAELIKKRDDQGPYIFGCLAASSLILMADWSLKPIHAVKEGDVVVGWTMVAGQRSKLVPTKVVATQCHRADTIAVQMQGGWRIVCTPEHQWWSGRRVGTNGRRIYSPVSMEKGGLSSLCRVVDLNSSHNWPAHPEAKEAAAYLAGIFDGEGTVSGKCIHISQCERTHPQVCERIRRSLRILEFKWSEHRPKGREHQVDFYLTGGRQEMFRFLLLCDPAKRQQVADGMFGARDFARSTREPIASITPGERQMVYNIETETGNYIADGFCSKNCQMLQDPTADDKQGFKVEWLKYASVTTRGQNLAILVDPASKKKPTSDYTSMWVIGLGPDRKVYVHDMLRDRLSLTERADTLIRWHRYWSAKGPIMAVAYEEYGLQADIEHAQSRMEDENYRFEITPVGGRLNKLDRIRRLIPWFEKGRIYLPATLVKTNYEGKPVDLVAAFKTEEYLAFPVAPHDDMLDALARFLDDDLPISFPLPIAEEDEREMELVGGRNQTTGY